MNKYKEAKAWIDKVNAHPEWARHDFEEPALSQLTELVEKATPQRPIYINDCEEFKPIVGYICPRCSDWVNEWTNYCSGCGQALDWSEEDVD